MRRPRRDYRKDGVTSPLIIAIDGPSASGKGTLAKRLAAHFGLPHLDTGLLYRAVGWLAERTGRPPAEIAATLQASDIDNPDLKDGRAPGKPARRSRRSRKYAPTY